MSVDQSFPMGLGTPISSLGSDFSANGKLYPGFVAQPLPTEPTGLYSAWREINGAQWMLQNADIGPAGFYLINPLLPGWAFVQYNNGGLEQATAPAGSMPGFTWTRLFYVDNHGVLQSPVANQNITYFNIVAYGAVAGGPDCTSAFQAAEAAAEAAGGGIVFVPAGIWHKSGTTTSTAGLPVSYQGVGGASQILMTASNDCFLFTTAVVADGCWVRDLHIQYSTGLTGAAIHCNSVQFIKVQNVYFQDCPQAIYLQQSLQTEIEDCLFVQQTNAAVNGVIQVGSFGVGHRAGNTCNIMNCVLRSNNVAGSVGINIAAAHQLWVTNCTIEQMLTGVYYVPSDQSQGVYFTNVHIAGPGVNTTGGTAVFMQIPVGFPGGVEAFDTIQFIGCDLQYNGLLTNVVDGVVLDPNGYGNNGIQNVYFVGTNVRGFTGAGVRVLGGKSIWFTGGSYSGNGIAGIWAQAAVQVRLTGVNCNGTSEFNSNIQNYGAVFVQSAGTVTVTGGGYNGNAIDAFYIDPSTSSVWIRGVDGVETNWGDTSSSVLATKTGDTTIDQLFSFIMPSGVMYTQNNGYQVRLGGSFTLAGAHTCNLWSLIGGSSRIILGGTFVAGETITYTLNGHNVVFTVGVGRTALNLVATDLATAINSDGTDGPLVTAAQVQNLVTQAQTTSIVAKTAAWQLSATNGTGLTQAVVTNSIAGTVSILGSFLIDTMMVYTTPGGANSGYDVEIALIGSNRSGAGHQAKVRIALGLAIVYNNVFTGSIDSTLDQTFAIYSQLSNAGDSLNNNILMVSRM